MGLFSTWFGGSASSNQKLRERAADLIPAANKAAVGMFMPLCERFPKLGELSLDDWDFFAATGAVYVAFQQLTQVKDPRPLYAIIGSALESKDKQATAALADCSGFVKNALAGMRPGDDPEQAISDAVGMWVLWNMYRRAPSYDESAPARAIGGLVSDSFREWWSV